MPKGTEYEQKDWGNVTHEEYGPDHPEQEARTDQDTTAGIEEHQAAWESGEKTDFTNTDEVEKFIKEINIKDVDRAADHILRDTYEHQEVNEYDRTLRAGQTNRPETESQPA
jgi:hypothetical protein